MIPPALPEVVPPPTSDFTYATPFSIPTKLYNHLLSPAYPYGAAAIYLALVWYINRRNRERAAGATANQPWAWSRSKLFAVLTVLYNVAWALFSAWTVRGMLQALYHSLPALSGRHGGHGAAAAGSSLVENVDALCKVHGPRGLGNGVTYNATTSIWTAPNVAVNVSPTGMPDSMDLGRLWNEGLAFYGWLFYVSTFMQLLDSAIVLAKGETVSLLPTARHAAAVITMWAGIRYMSPPIWLTVLSTSILNTMKVNASSPSPFPTLVFFWLEF
jgi:hypothetical protein